MDIFWTVLGIFLMLAGLAGSVLPFIPGPPLCFIGLLLQQLKETPPFTGKFLWIWAGVTVAVIVLEYVIPLLGAKKYGGTKYGIWGCTIGLIAGIWLGPLGIIIGPFVGAFIGEIMAHSDSERALKAAWGSFVGFLAGTLLKLVVCFVMSYYFVVSLF